MVYIVTVMLRHITIPASAETYLEHCYLYYARTCAPPARDENPFRHVQSFDERWVVPDRTSFAPVFGEGSREAYHVVCDVTGKPKRKRLADRGCYLLWVEWYGTEEDPPPDTPVLFSVTGTVAFHCDGSRSVQAFWEGEMGGYDYPVKSPDWAGVSEP